MFGGRSASRPRHEPGGGGQRVRRDDGLGRPKSKLSARPRSGAAPPASTPPRRSAAGAPAPWPGRCDRPAGWCRQRQPDDDGDGRDDEAVGEDFRPTRPQLDARSRCPATPTTSEEKKSGTTIISSSRRKSVPIGSVKFATNHSTPRVAAAPEVVTASPARGTPTPRPMRMRVCSGIPFGRSPVVSLRSVVASRCRRRFERAPLLSFVFAHSAFIFPT